MSIVSSVLEFATRYRHHREAVQTERLLAALPSDIRADIGWPAVVPDRARGLVRSHH